MLAEPRDAIATIPSNYFILCVWEAVVKQGIHNCVHSRGSANITVSVVQCYLPSQPVPESLLLQVAWGALAASAALRCTLLSAALVKWWMCMLKPTQDWLGHYHWAAKLASSLSISSFLTCQTKRYCFLPFFPNRSPHPCVTGLD